MGQAKKSRSIRRSDHQAAYIKGVLSLKRNMLSPGAVIVEAGCSWGALLSQFGGNGRTLICFEPGTRFLRETYARLNSTGSKEIEVVPTMFNENWSGLSGGIDLFLSSHVLEHIGDLCTFLAKLYDKIKPGGFVFSEVPNANYEYIRKTLGGTYHITLLTPVSLSMYFYATGFRLVDMSLTDDADAMHGNGFHIRALFWKPSKSATVPLSYAVARQRSGVWPNHGVMTAGWNAP